MDRLNKYLAHAGVGSRRKVERLISAGRVAIDGAVVRELGVRVAPGQRVKVDGKPIEAEQLAYWMVNKPIGYLCTNHDPAGRPRAIDLIPAERGRKRLYTVGRLDEGSEGLLLLTNDGELANRLMHPRFGVEKTYIVQVAGQPTVEDLDLIRKGIWLSDGRVAAKHVKRIKRQGGSTWLRIVLAEGKNREIRRMLARLKHKVMKLRRVAIASVQLKGIGPGKARKLSKDELRALRRAASMSSAQSEEKDQPDEPRKKTSRATEQ